jgi:hypothetical protein
MAPPPEIGGAFTFINKIEYLNLFEEKTEIKL